MKAGCKRARFSPEPWPEWFLLSLMQHSGQGSGLGDSHFCKAAQQDYNRFAGCWHPGSWAQLLTYFHSFIQKVLGLKVWPDRHFKSYTGRILLAVRPSE